MLCAGLDMSPIKLIRVSRHGEHQHQVAPWQCALPRGPRGQLLQELRMFIEASYSFLLT